MKKVIKALYILLAAIAFPAVADDHKKDLFGAGKARDSKFPGEYVGEYIDGDKKIKYGLQIFALGNGKFRAVGYNDGLPGDSFKPGGKIERVEGKKAKSKKGTERIIFQNDDEQAIATLKNGNIVAREDGKIIARLKKVERKNPVIPEPKKK